jgi:hypothetical protein
MGKILFLDDMGWRHSEFTRRSDRDPTLRVWQAHSAKGAIALLESTSFDQVFLDHDLSEDDIMIKVGEKGTVPTGMDVVDHILTMENPPRDIIIHSCNRPAAEEMMRRLESISPNKVFSIRRIPFPELLHAIDSAYRTSSGI